MNREAVAVAADCTLTVHSAAGDKFHESVDKVFTLSQDPPVVLMVYGRVELAGVPWQTLAEEFSRTQAFGHGGLAECAEQFCAWVVETTKVPSEDAGFLWRECLAAVVRDSFPLGPDRRQRISEPGRRQQRWVQHVQQELDRYRSADPLDGLSEHEATQLAKQQRTDNAAVYDEILDWIPTTQPELREIRETLSLILAESTVRSMTGGHASGAVLAGFGVTDRIPSVVELPCITVEQQHIRLSTRKSVSVTVTRPARVRHYAQSDEIEAFFRGVHPEIEAALDQQWGLTQLFSRAMEKMVHDSGGELPEDAIECMAVLDALKTTMRRVADEWAKEQGELSKSRAELADSLLKSPAIQGLAFMPRRDLGAFAEHLISQSSWRHRASTRLRETTGDMVNVAILSRAGGLEWKRADDPRHKKEILPH